MARTREQRFSVAAEWRTTRRLYPIYAAIAREFQMGDPPCESLNEVNERSEPDVLQRIGQWLTEMDQRIQAHHFRQLLQTSDLASSEDKMHTLVDRYLNQEHRTEFDRDKIDFLLSQYFSVCAPPSFHDREVSLEEVAEVLEPILGECPSALPDWLRSLEQLVADMQGCRGLADLERQRIIERGRELKAASGERYFGSSALLAFTRFNYLLRYACLRLVESDLRAIEAGLWELGARNVYFVDCTSVQLSPQEPLSNLFQLCLNLRKPLNLEYSIDNSFDLLMELRTTIERALAAPDVPVPDVQRRLERIEEEMLELRTLLEQVLAHGKIERAASLTPAPPQAAAPPDAHEKPRVSPPLSSAAAVPPASPPSAALPPPPSPRPSDGADGAKVAPSSPATISVQIEHIKELLSASGSKGRSSVSLAIGPTTKMLLTTAEINAFLKDGDEVGVAIQRAVAARFLLVANLEDSKRTKEKLDLTPFLESARDESANLQTQKANAEKAGRTSLAEALSFTHRQLLAIIIHAERLAR
ncbi:MAG: hypothetical protein M3O85_02535 [Acidobacteriota bacterium]|nr:hypothetical protein [Acidobacteriota bacterium]